ncbi:MAG: hypothetical protein EBR62_07295, partial [Verrucomicrobia bacterium]|nr:hypothetical protein [Verrucomicrobiota bacterium]
MLAWTNPFPSALDAELVWVGLRLAAGLYVIVRAIGARVSLGYTLLWGPAVIFFPIVTATVLFLFGGRKHSALAQAKQRIKAAAQRLAGPIRPAGNAIRLLGDRDGGDTLAALHAEILAAKHRIHLSTYILSPDAVGREIISLLVRRAREGVEVRLLVDAVGSWGTPTRLCRPLLKAGGQVARFNPVLPMQGKGSANWRNHRKLALFDSQVAILGGQNLGLAYMGREPSNRRFRDCSFRVTGPAAAALEQVFIADWCQATDADPAAFADVLRSQPSPQGEAEVEVIPSGPDCVSDPLWEKYVALIENARTSLTIVTPYFIPDQALFRLLVAAATKGRRVRVLVPRRSDHRLLDFARRWYLRQLKEAGAEGAEIPFTTSPAYDQRLVQALQQMLQEVGLKVTIRMTDHPTFLKRRQGNPDEAGSISTGLWSCGCQDADGVINPLFRTGSSWAKYSNPRFDALIDAARATIDEKERLAHYADALRILHEDVPGVGM